MIQFYTLLVNKIIYNYKQAGLVVSLFCLLLFTKCSGDTTIIASVDKNELIKDDATLMINHLGYSTENPKE